MIDIDFQQELTTHPNLAPNRLVGQELKAHDLTDAFGPDWYDHCDSLVKNLHELLTSGELPREHICYKFLKDVIGYIHCMTKQDRRQQVCWSRVALKMLIMTFPASEIMATFVTAFAQFPLSKTPFV